MCPEICRYTSVWWILPSDVVLVSWPPFGSGNREWCGHCEPLFWTTSWSNAFIALNGIKTSKTFAYATRWGIHTLNKRTLKSTKTRHYNVMQIKSRCACANEVYGSVFVCLCRVLQLLNDMWSTSKIFYRLLVMFSWIEICKIMLRSRVIARFSYLECHCSLFRTVWSETCPCSVATLLSS